MMLRPTVVSSVTDLSGSKMIGWWVTISSAPHSTASRHTPSKGSSATRTLVTGVSRLPQSSPTLSQSIFM